MINFILYFTLMCIAFYFLIKSSDYLITTASTLGKRVGLSKFIIGITIVAIGTSLPELITAIIAIFTSSSPEPFVFGTVIGSNISNILFVFGVLILFSVNLKINFKKQDIYILIFSSILLLIVMTLDKTYKFIGLIMVLIYIYYIYITLKANQEDKFIEEIKEKTFIDKASNMTLSYILLFSILILNLSARGVILAIEELGVILNVPIEYLTLTTVALATSLPEAIVTYVSAKQKESDIAIGNIIGSNISNILLIIGFSTLIYNFTIDVSIYYFSLFMMILSTSIFLIFIFKKNLTRKHAIILFILYLLFIISIFY